MFYTFTVRCIATAIFYYNHVCMLVFDGKAIAIFRYFVIIILYCKSIHSDFFQQDTFFSSPDPKGQVSYCHHWASVRPLTFHILINSSETTRPIWTKLWWNGPWMAPFQNCGWWSRLPTKMATKLKIEKRGDEILIVHCCFNISQNELKF